jgi:ABC-type multidrug transport system fused ATPase/permease subunit
MKHGSGYVATRISDDARQLGSLMAGTYIDGLSSLALLLAGLGIMLAVHPPLATAVLVVVPGFVWVNGHFGHRVQSQSEQVQERKGIANATRLESLDAAHVARAFERGKFEARRLARALCEEVEIGLRRSVTTAGAGALQMLLYSAGGLILLWHGASEIVAGRLTLGQFVAFNALLAYVYGPMNQLSGLYVNLRQGMGVLRRVLEVLDMPPEVSRGEGRRHIEMGKVVFEDVRFGYGTGRPVLNGVTLSLEPGRITALVGPTGAGKTTLLNLLLRFYNPASGRILIDGEELQGFDVQALRRHIGSVEQEVRLFSGTIRENIAYGKQGVTEDDIQKAAGAMHCEEFIHRYPDGYGTRVGAGGIQLSGGQKQRIALARAVLRNPRILILDEATSSLDARSEEIVQDALKRAAAGRTTLLIAHRLSTVSIADRVLVLVGGRIAEAGTFQELMERDGHLRRSYRKDLARVAV